MPSEDLRVPVFYCVTPTLVMHVEAAYMVGFCTYELLVSGIQNSCGAPATSYWCPQASPPAIRNSQADHQRGFQRPSVHLLRLLIFTLLI
jgi:hypothetical protein